MYVGLLSNGVARQGGDTLVELCGRRSWAPTPLGTDSLAPVLVEPVRKEIASVSVLQAILQANNHQAGAGEGQVSYLDGAARCPRDPAHIHIGAKKNNLLFLFMGQVGTGSRWGVY